MSHGLPGSGGHHAGPGHPGVLHRGDEGGQLPLDFLVDASDSIAWQEADGNTPNYINLVRLADFFDVSMDYLAGRTDKREVNR